MIIASPGTRIHGNTQKTSKTPPSPAPGGVLGGDLLVFCVFPCILVPGEAILMPILVDIATLPKLVQFSDYVPPPPGTIANKKIRELTSRPDRKAQVQASK